MQRILAEVGLQDGIGFEDVVTFFAGVGVVLTTLGLVFRKPMKELTEFLGWWRKFQRDWDGEVQAPGRMAVPGIMERLNRVDGEFNRNGGHTMKDSQFRTERNIKAIATYNQAANLVHQQNLAAVSDSLQRAGVDAPIIVALPPGPVIIESPAHAQEEE